MIGPFHTSNENCVIQCTLNLVCCMYTYHTFTGDSVNTAMDDDTTKANSMHIPCVHWIQCALNTHFFK